MATRFELELRNESIARALASGYPPDKVCVLYGLTPEGLRDLEARDDFRSLVRTYQERWRLVLEQKAHYAELILGKALRVLDADLDDPGSRTRVTTAQQIAAWFLKAAYDSKGERNVNINVNQQTILSLGEAFKRVVEVTVTQPNAIPIDEDPHLLEPGSDHPRQ